MFTRCPCCDEFSHTVYMRAKYTAYADARLNVIWCCEYCYKLDCAYWLERWEEYWSNVM